MESISGKGEKLPFANSLHRVAMEIFIQKGASREEQENKKANGFYVEENATWTIEEMNAQIRAKGGLSYWMRNEATFDIIIRLLACDSVIFEEDGYLPARESELRLRLFSDAQH